MKNEIVKYTLLSPDEFKSNNSLRKVSLFPSYMVSFSQTKD